MARNKNSVQFTPDYKVLCKELNETTTVSTHLPFDSSYTVYASEFIESDSASNIVYDSSKKITCYRFEEDVTIIVNPTVYATTFTPEISYSASTGFTINNLNTLLTDTNTTINDWNVGIVSWHNAVCRKSRNRVNGNMRRRRTTWSYSDGTGGEALMTINSSGLISNTANIHSVFKGNTNDREINGDSFKPFIGIRLRYRRNTTYRTLYSDKFFNYNGTYISKFDLPLVRR